VKPFQFSETSTETANNRWASRNALPSESLCQKMGDGPTCPLTCGKLRIIGAEIPPCHPYKCRREGSGYLFLLCLAVTAPMTGDGRVRGHILVIAMVLIR